MNMITAIVNLLGEIPNLKETFYKKNIQKAALDGRNERNCDKVIYA